LADLLVDKLADNLVDYSVECSVASKEYLLAELLAATKVVYLECWLGPWLVD
jgi:hypothetical protein